MTLERVIESCSRAEEQKMSTSVDSTENIEFENFLVRKFSLSSAAGKKTVNSFRELVPNAMIRLDDLSSLNENLLRRGNSEL